LKKIATYQNINQIYQNLKGIILTAKKSQIPIFSPRKLFFG